jgi:nuclease S1
MSIMPVRLIALGVLLITCKQALGWSDEAHIAICEIALLEVSPETRQMINTLQKNEDNRNHVDFSLACTWADQPPRKRSGEHFINVPRNQAEISGPDCPIGDTCLFTAIDQDMQIISGNGSSNKEKWEALKYLGHWVGDIHQPLHVSFRDDNGGNKIAMLNEDGCFKTLHGAWDHCIPERIMLVYGIDDPKEFGRTLRSEITAEERQRWRSDQSTTTWANESLGIALKPVVGYCIQKEQYCQYDENRVVYENGGEQKLLPLSETYKKANSELVVTRIKQAGIRLAKLLDDIAE